MSLSYSRLQLTRLLSECTQLEEASEKAKRPKSERTPYSDIADNVLADRKGLFLASSGRLLQFNVSRCTDTEIFQARHVNELQPTKDTIHIRLDAAQRGLGTGSCGPQTLAQYQVNGVSYEVNFWLKSTGY